MLKYLSGDMPLDRRGVEESELVPDDGDRHISIFKINYERIFWGTFF